MDLTAIRKDLVYNLYTFYERHLSDLILQAFIRKLINENGTVNKKKLRKLLASMRDTCRIDQLSLGNLLLSHGFLDWDRKGKNNEFILNQKKLAVVTEAYVKFFERESVTTLSEFVVLKHLSSSKQKTEQSRNSQESFKVESNMAENYQLLTLSVQSIRENMKINKIELLKEKPCDIEVKTGKDGIAVFHLNREFFKKPKTVYQIQIFADSGDVEIYSLTVQGSLELAIYKIRSMKESSAPLGGHARRLWGYYPDKKLRSMFTKDFELLQPLGFNKNQKHAYLYRFNAEKAKISSTNFKSVFPILVEVEDFFICRKIKDFKMEDVAILKAYEVLAINISNIKDFPDVIEEADFIKLRTVNKKTEEKTEVIWKMEEGYIYFIPEYKIDIKQRYLVEFEKNRTSIQMAREALKNITDKTINAVLFPTRFSVKPEENFQFEWFNIAIATNSEQQQAIKNIVKETAFPAPYIIFGPPGTGKTSTIVETVAQIWKLKPKSKMLITAPSNAACDEIAIRLLQYIPAEELYRYFAKSALLKRIKDVPKELLLISNYDFPLSPPLHSWRSLKHVDLLKRYNIILTTVVQSGRLELQGMPKDYFDYVFLDECGSSTEPESLIPISGCVGSSRKTNIVIAGDPKQLGPVVKCEFAENAGLGLSLLERLMDMEFYKPKDGKFNEKIITKLLQNFRSHPAILEVPNKLFYDNELIAKAKPERADFALNWKFLPNKKFPIIFHGIEGETKSDAKSPSLYNDQEIKQVQFYVREIVKNGINGKQIPLSEIGIVSPYRLQCQKLLQIIRCSGWREIEVGSCEQFQGKEKMVIILSTVRSYTKSVGFLRNPKRLNVAITRAKGLLIVIGNPKTLRLDSNWEELLQFYEENGACVK